MVVERVDFLSIASQDIERSRRFYLETLGLPLACKTPMGRSAVTVATGRTRCERTSELLEAVHAEEASPARGDAGNALMLHRRYAA